MKTKSGTVIKRIRNPHPEKWAGPWFSFSRLIDFTSGYAHHGMINRYLSDSDYAALRKHFRKTLAKAEGK